MQTSATQQLPKISSAVSLSLRPMKMAARAAPPMPIKELNAVIRVITGKVTPTPVRAVAPMTGMWPMYIRSTILYKRLII